MRYQYHKQYRLKGYNYGKNGFYFITVCTKDSVCYFGDIQKGNTKLSEIGKIANRYWMDIPKHFPFVLLDAFVVMPDHVHGIVVINHKPVRTHNDSHKNNRITSVCTHHDAYGPVLNDDLYLLSTNNNQFGPQSNNLSSIIRHYKGAVKRWANLHQIPFAWRPRFYDRIIRDEIELERIREYISENPGQWEASKDYFPHELGA